MKWINQKELGDITGLSRAALANWSAQPGCPKKVANGRTLYAWPDWNEWRFQEGRRSKAPEDVEEARARKLAAEAELAEIERDRERGLLVPLADVEREVGVVLDRLRAKLVALPGKWGPLLVGCRTIAEATGRLEPAVADAMADLSYSGDEAEEAA